MILIKYLNNKISVETFSGKEWKLCHDVARQVAKGNVEKNGRIIDLKWFDNYIRSLLDRYELPKLTADSDQFKTEEEFNGFIKNLSFLLLLKSMEGAL